MPTLTIPDEIYERLAKRAAVLNVTVDQLIAPLLNLVTECDHNGHRASSPAEIPFDDWKNRFDSWMADVKGRAQRYPSGFVVDDSRESIYKGCGE
jgi:hypothetical protein